MSELIHPPIDYELEAVTTSESRIVDDILVIMKLRKCTRISTMDNIAITSTITERMDLVSNDNKTELAMRILRTPVMTSSSNDEQSMYGSNKYIVMEVQFGEIPVTREEDLLVDEDYSWHPYFMVIIDKKDIDHPELVNTETGEPLSDIELMRVSVVINKMKTKAEMLLLPDEVQYEEDEPAYDKKKVKHVGAISAKELRDDAYPSEDCDNCAERGVDCIHPMAN